MGKMSIELRILLLSIIVTFAMGVFVVSDVYAEKTEFKIPDWVKHVAGLWYDDRITDHTFLAAIKYLIENNIIVIPSIEDVTGTGGAIPEWVKNTAGWWADDQINDETFVSVIQYLIQEGLIQIPESSSSSGGSSGGGGY